MRNLCREFQLASVEHITALVALYRPGRWISSRISSAPPRQGGIKCEHPLLEEISEETYGILFIKSR